MPENPRAQLVLGVIVTAAIGVIVALVIAPGGGSGGLGDRLVISTGSGAEFSEELPYHAIDATAAGWTDLVRCFKGRGRYFTRTTAQGQPLPYLLLYDVDDDLVGVYLVSTTEMPDPWKHLEDGLIGVADYEFEHWSLPVYVQDPLLACGPAVAGGRFHD